MSVLVVCAKDHPGIPGPRTTCRGCDEVLIRDTFFPGPAFCFSCAGEIAQAYKDAGERVPRIATHRAVLLSLVSWLKTGAVA